MLKFFYYFIICAFISLSAFDWPNYRLEKIEVQNNCILLILNDSSVWQTDIGNLEDLQNFPADVPLFITVNNNWFYQKHLPFQLILTGQKNQYAVNAKHLFCPVIDNPLNYFIQQLNLENNTLISNRDFHFLLNLADFAIYQTWKKGDLLALGKNNERFAKYPLILINLNTNDYVRAISF